MGKKGKKKAKVTGAPDVVKFKTTEPRYFSLMGVVEMYENLPEVRKDMLSPTDMKRLYKFYTMLGALSGMCAADGEKHYRHRLHHAYLYPQPQYNPMGYRADLLERCRKVVDTPALKFNGKTFPWTRWADKDLITKADNFLEQVDKMSMSIPTFISDSLPDFAQGLKKFKYDLADRLVKLDDLWREQEELMMQVWLEVHEEVFSPISLMVQIEAELSKAEAVDDMKEKQKLENELVKAIEAFYNAMYPSKKSQAPTPWVDEVIPLSEACVFYETKSSPEGLNLCRHVIKVFVELRVCISFIPAERMYPEYEKNTTLCRLMNSFKKAVDDAEEHLALTAGLPSIGNFKREGWMTRDLMEPEVADLNGNAFKIRDVMIPEEKDVSP